MFHHLLQKLENVILQEIQNRQRRVSRVRSDEHIENVNIIGLSLYLLAGGHQDDKSIRFCVTTKCTTVGSDVANVEVVELNRWDAERGFRGDEVEGRGVAVLPY